MGLKSARKNIFRSWWTGVVLLLVLIAGLAVSQKVSNDKQAEATQTIRSEQAASERFEGLNYGVALSGDLYAIENAKRMEILNKIKKAGFTEVRLSLNWDKAETKRGTYDWGHLDSMMKAVKKSGLTMILQSNTTPSWARRDICKESSACPPQTPVHYANFMAAAAERYKTYDVNAWEIWNEQNGNNFWKPQPNPEQYAELLKTSYVEIKKADKDAIVLIGGLSGDSVDLIGPNLIDPRTYLIKLYDAGIAGYYDGLAYHPYLTDIGLPDKKGEYNGWAKMNTGNNSIRKIMAAHGDADKDIWITEFGIPTGGSGTIVTDPNNIPAKADHATYEAHAAIVQAYVDELNEMPWVRSFDWYSYKDDTTAKTFSGAAFGIWKLDGTSKPVLEVLQKGIQQSKERANRD